MMCAVLDSFIQTLTAGEVLCYIELKLLASNFYPLVCLFFGKA